MSSKGKACFCPDFIQPETNLARGLELINFTYVQELELATGTSKVYDHTETDIRKQHQTWKGRRDVQQTRMMLRIDVTTYINHYYKSMMSH